METTNRKCRIINMNDVSATRPDNKARIIRMPQRPVLYFFNIG